MRLSLLRATSVAGLLSILGWALPVVAQSPPIVPRPGTPVPTAPPPAAAPSGTSVVVIDVAYIFKNHGRFNARMNDIKKDVEAFDAQIRTEQQNLQTKMEGLKSFGPSSPEYRNLEVECARADADLRVKAGLKKKEFLEREARVYYDVYKEIEATVKVFCQQYRIGLVLRFNGDDMKPDDRASVLNGVNKAVVFQQNLDITEHILVKLNGTAAPPTQTPGAPQPTVNQGGGPINTATRPQPITPAPGGARPTAPGGIQR